jgi:predicted DNA-binding transcriptional regulator AlpA
MLPELDVSTIPAADIPAALATLAAWQSALATRLMSKAAPEAAPNELDRMLTTAEAAELLRRSVKWLYRRNGTLPFARKLSDRSWVYSEAGLRRWLARRK